MKILLYFTLLTFFYFSISLLSQELVSVRPHYFSSAGPTGLNQSYSHYSETAGSLLVSIIPNFTNPVEVGTNDSLDISITIQNPSVSQFPWLAYVSELSGGEKKEASPWSWIQSSMPVVFIITLCRREKTGTPEK